MIRAAGTHGTPLLSVNDSTGGSDRRVDVGVGIPMRMIVNQPATNPSSAGFGVFGFLGISSANQAAIAPGVGSVAFQICVFDPSNAMLFAFADTLGGSLCGAPFRRPQHRGSSNYRLGFRVAHPSTTVRV